MDSSELLKVIVGLSETMLSEATAGEWDQLVETQGRRDDLIKEYFPIDESCEKPEQIRQHVANIRAIDHQIIALAKVHQKSLGESLGQISVGRQASKAYKKTSSY